MPLQSLLECCSAGFGRSKSIANNEENGEGVSPPLRGPFSPSSFSPQSSVWSLLVRFVRNTHRVCPLDLCCYRRLLVLPKDTTLYTVGLLLIRPSYTLSGLAPKPSPEAKTRLCRVGLVAGIHTTRGPVGLSGQPTLSSLGLCWAATVVRGCVTPGATMTSLRWRLSGCRRIRGKAACLT